VRVSFDEKRMIMERRWYSCSLFVNWNGTLMTQIMLIYSVKHRVSIVQPCDTDLVDGLPLWVLEP